MVGHTFRRLFERPSRNRRKNNLLKIALVGNCQTSALRSIFNRSVDIEVAAVADVNLRGTPMFEKDVQKIAEGKDFDFVLSQPMSDDFGDISSANLKKIYGDKFRKFTNVYFSGLHPDLSYFGSFGQRFASPLGEYHSKIALMCYSKKIDPSRCVSLFTQRTYETLHYFDAYEHSSNEMLRRDDSNDIKFASVFLEFSKIRMLLYTINHPSSACMVLLAKTLAESLGANGAQFEHDIYTNLLVESQIWPIYPEIGSAHELKYKTEMQFYPATNTGRRPMNIEQFVYTSYEMYDAVGRGKFMNEALARELSDIAI